MGYRIQNGHNSNTSRLRNFMNDCQLDAKFMISMTAMDTTSILQAQLNQIDDPQLTSEWIPQSEDDFAVLALRNLIFDLCDQNGGGHGGSAVGMGAIGVALWKYVMRYNPADPDWFDRDRFVLSNGVLVQNDELSWGI